MPTIEPNIATFVTQTAHGLQVDKLDLNAGKRKAAEAAEKQALVNSRQAALADTTAFTQLQSTHLVDFLQTGKVGQKAGADSFKWDRDDLNYEGDTLALGNITDPSAQSYGDNVAVVLSDEGKKFLAQNGGSSLDQSLAALKAPGKASRWGGSERYMLGREVQDSPTFDPAKHVDSILATPDQAKAMQQQYADAVTKGKAPATIGQTPYQDFFKQKLKPTDDMYATLEAEVFGHQVPGFKELPEQAKRPVATIASMLAASYPQEVPADIRRRLAFEKTSYHQVPWDTLRPGLGKGDQVMDFYHGNTNPLVALTNFAGDPKSLIAKLPDSLKEKYKLNDFHTTEVYGPGVYSGNPSVASNYAIRKIDGTNPSSAGEKAVQKPVYVVNGKLNVGNEVQDDLAKHPEAHTRVVPDTGDMGPYRVTRDGWDNMRVTGITKLDPNASPAAVLPDLLKAYSYQPEWATEQLADLDAGAVKKAVLKMQAAGGLDTKVGQKLLTDLQQKQATKVVAENTTDGMVKSFFGKMLHAIH